MNYPFVKTDGGRSDDKRRPHKGDCVIRAVALATGIAYSECYDELEDFYGKSRGGMNIKNWIDLQHYNETNFRGFSFHWVPFKAVKGQKRMNPVTFCQQFKDGTYIARTAKHVFAVIDGVIHDSWKQRKHRCIYGAWKVEYTAPDAPAPQPAQPAAHAKKPITGATP